MGYGRLKKSLPRSPIAQLTRLMHQGINLIPNEMERTIKRLFCQMLSYATVVLENEEKPWSVLEERSGRRLGGSDSRKQDKQ